VLSTFIAVWEILKWRAKNAVSVQCTSNMVFIHSSDKKTYIIAKVVNRGDTQTTITHFLGYYWPSRVDKILKKM